MPTYTEFPTVPPARRLAEEGLTKMHHVLTDLVSGAMNLPSWAPKVARRTAAVVLIMTFWLAPDSFRAGFELWVKTQTQLMMDRMAPLLSPEPEGVEPDRPAR